MKIRYAKSVFLTLLYAGSVLAVYCGLTKLSGNDTSIDGFAITLACSSILLHFMDKEDKEEEE